MALTKTWVRTTIGPLVVPNWNQGQFRYLGQSTAPTGSSTLLRSIASLEVQVLVGANTGTVPTGGWWSTSYSEMRLSWYTVQPGPPPPLNDNSKTFVSRSLAETSFEPIVSTPGIYVVRFKFPPIDTPVMRKVAGPSLPHVYLQAYHADSVSALSGLNDTVITFSGWVDCLWGDVL